VVGGREKEIEVAEPDGVILAGVLVGVDGTGGLMRGEGG
jgi:hypothetical protein